MTNREGRMSRSSATSMTTVARRQFPRVLSRRPSARHMRGLHCGCLLLRCLVLLAWSVAFCPGVAGAAEDTLPFFGLRLVWSEGSDLRWITVLEVRFRNARSDIATRTVAAVPDPCAFHENEIGLDYATLESVLERSYLHQDPLGRVDRGPIEKVLVEVGNSKLKRPDDAPVAFGYLSIQWRMMCGDSESHGALAVPYSGRASMTHLSPCVTELVSSTLLQFYDGERVNRLLSVPRGPCDPRRLRRLLDPIAASSAFDESRAHALRACWALGGRPELSALLDSRSEAVRASAVYLRARNRGTGDTGLELARILYGDASERVRWACVRCLTAIAYPYCGATRDALESGLPMTIGYSFEAIASGLASCGSRRGIEWFRRAAESLGAETPVWVLSDVPHFMDLRLPKGTWKEANRSESRSVVLEAFSRAADWQWDSERRRWLLQQ